MVITRHFNVEILLIMPLNPIRNKSLNQFSLVN